MRGSSPRWSTKDASEAHLDEYPALTRGAAGSTPARGTAGKWRSSVVLAGLISLRSRVRIPPSPPMTSSSSGRAVGCYPIRCWFESSGVSAARDGHRGAPDPCKIGSQGSTPCRSTSRCSSVARAAPCRGEGRGFESRHWRTSTSSSAAELLPYKESRGGSSPSGCTLAEAEAVEAPGRDPGGSGFESRPSPQASVEQLAGSRGCRPRPLVGLQVRVLLGALLTTRS